MIVQVLAKVEDFDISVSACIGLCASWCEVGGHTQKYVERM
jgi:hypothetical protein